DGRHAPVEVAGAKRGHAGDRLQPLDQPGGQRPLVRGDRLGADLDHVASGGGGAGDALEVDRAGLPRAGRLVVRRAHLVGADLFGQLATAIQHAHVRAEVAVGGAVHGDTAHGVYVHLAVGRGLYAVHVP